MLGYARGSHLAGVMVTRGRVGRRVARMRGTPVGRGRCVRGGAELHARDSEPSAKVAHAALVVPPMASWFPHAGFAGSRMGGVGGRSEP